MHLPEIYKRYEHTHNSPTLQQLCTITKKQKLKKSKTRICLTKVVIILQLKKEAEEAERSREQMMR